MVFVFGITGNSGAGKTSISKQILDVFGSDVVSIVEQDNFYYSRKQVEVIQNTKDVNFDHPSSINFERLIECVNTLKNSQPYDINIYDFAKDDYSDQFITCKPTNIIIIEGILIFTAKEIRDLFDVKLFIDTDSDICLARRIIRDIKERHRSLESVIDQYIKYVKPCSENFIFPMKKYADVIIPHGSMNKVALGMIFFFIQKVIKKEAIPGNISAEISDMVNTINKKVLD